MKMLRAIVLMSCAWAGTAFGAVAGKRVNPIKVYVKNESKVDLQVGIVDIASAFKHAYVVPLKPILAKDASVQYIGAIDLENSLQYVYTGVRSQKYEYRVSWGEVIDRLKVSRSPASVLITISYTGAGPAWKFTETITPYNG